MSSNREGQDVVGEGNPPCRDWRGHSTLGNWPVAAAAPARRDYTPDSSGSCPVLSPNASSRTPNLAIRLSDRFASGVPFG